MATPPLHHIRRDPVSGRWVIVSMEKTWSKELFAIEPHERKGGTCPFCHGNEALTPPEVYAARPGGGPPNASGWAVRVVPNKFPALKIEGDLEKSGIGVYDLMNGVGAHEVVVENPEHDKNLDALTPQQMEQVLAAYFTRAHEMHKDPRFRYIMIFKNYGLSAGASLEHPHTQLIALPIVPKRVKEELIGAEQYFAYRERCIFCDMIRQEQEERDRVIIDDPDFIAFAPFCARFPFETWIAPKTHQADFILLKPELIGALAKVLQSILQRIKTALGDPSYNFMIYTSPLEDRYRDDYHWRIEVTPRLTRVAGFEWGSGFYYNRVSPEVCAQALREVPP